MGEKRYEVYDGDKLIGSNMPLDVAFCLIRGYADTYFNQPLDIKIKEIIPTQSVRI